MLLNWNNNFWAWLRWCPSLLLSKLYPLRNEGKGKGEEDNEQNVQVMVSSTKNHEERNPGLKDVVFSWSIRDIMNNNLYKNEVKRIQETFSSVECYLNSFVVPLIEEMRTDLRSAMTNLPFAPAREILEIQISKNFHPPKALSYILKLKKSVNIFNVHEPEVGDLIALAEVRPKCVDDLNGPRFSYLVALVENMNDDPNSIEIVSSKLILLDDEEISGEENGKTRDTLFVIHLTNLKTNLRIWKALHPGEGGNMDILNSVLGVNPSLEEKCDLCSEKMESSDMLKSRGLIMSLGLDDSQRDAVLKCIALRECTHRNSVKLIWGPPGTGKTKTTASLLFSLFRMRCRTLTCAPTNVAVLGVAKRLMSCLDGTLEYETYGLGDVVLFGNGKRMKIGEHEDLHDVFLDAPEVGWKGCVIQMIRLLEDPDSQYQRYLAKLKVKDKNDEDGEENNGNIGTDFSLEGRLSGRAGPVIPGALCEHEKWCPQS